MNNELQAISDAWDKSVGEGRDENEARRLADRYVEAHPEQFAVLATLTQEQCVQAIDVLRDQPNNNLAPVVCATILGADATPSDWFRIQVWLWHRYEPQNIGGEVEAKLRIPTSG